MLPKWLCVLAQTRVNHSSVGCKTSSCRFYSKKIETFDNELYSSFKFIINIGGNTEQRVKDNCKTFIHIGGRADGNFGNICWQE